MRSQWGAIEYCLPIVADRKAGRAYMVGAAADFRLRPEEPRRFYVLCIDYAHASSGKGAPLTLYYTDPLQEAFDCQPVLTADGDLLFAGGIPLLDNFTPSRSVYLFRLSSKRGSSLPASANWWWLLLAAAMVIVILTVLWLWRRRIGQRNLVAECSVETKRPSTNISPSANDELMNRIKQLMEEQRLYLNSELKLEDIASALGLNRTYVSDCINTHTGDSFSQFVNGYRIEYAKRVLRSQPDTKVTSLYLSAGFSSEQSFYRNFKAFTGMTPKEWIASQKD